MIIGCSKISQIIKTNKILIILIFISLTGFSQDRKRIEIRQADYMDHNEQIIANAERIIGNVIIEHNNILMWCDSAYSYSGTNKVDAFGNVHINKEDSIHLYADKIFYNGDLSSSRSVGNVRLVKQNTVLYTDTLDYDLDKNIGYYDDNGRIVDSTNVLSSIIGQYFVDENIVYFYNDVKGKGDDYDLYCDSLKYNTETSTIFIESPTTISDSSNILFAKDGWYDTKSGLAELLDDPIIFNDIQQLQGKKIVYNRETGEGVATGSVNIFDLDNRMIVTGEKVYYNENLKTATVTDSAVMIMYSEGDSLFMHADTLKTIPDTIDGEKIIKAYYGVRYWRKDIQGICDSLVYFTNDSTVRLHNTPIIWAENRQLAADYIEMKSYNNAPDEIRLRNNSFIISKMDTIMFDQIKGKNMIGYVKDNELFKIDVDGNGQTLYYAQDEEDIIGLNKAESSKISISFKDGTIHRISLISNPEGNLKPLFQLVDTDKRLDGFQWMIDIRPVSKFDIFRK